MDSEERVLRALNLEEPDQVPMFELGINDPKVEEILGRRMTDEESTEMFVTAYRKLKLDIVPTWLDELIFYKGGIDPVGREYYWDEEARTDWYVRGLVKNEADLEKFSPDPSDERYYKRTKKTVKLAKEDLFILGAMNGPFQYVSQSMGLEYFLRGFYLSPDLMKRSFDLRTRFVIETAKRMIDLGVDGIILCEDSADTHGPHISPRLYEEYVFPCHRRCVEEIGKTVPVLVHCCGSIWPIIDLLFKAGFAGIHPLEPVAGMNIRRVKEKYGDKWCLLGNVDCSQTLCIKDKNEVVEETKLCLESAAPGGGLILSSSNSVHNAVKIENFLEMLRTGRKYGRYPM